VRQFGQDPLDPNTARVGAAHEIAGQPADLLQCEGHSGIIAPHHMLVSSTGPAVPGLPAWVLRNALMVGSDDVDSA
jgi:hypothetical protein